MRPTFIHAVKLANVIVGNVDIESLFNRHNKFGVIKRIKAQIGGERRIANKLRGGLAR